MSQYSRNERNANAGIVVGITPADYAAHGEGPAGRHRIAAALGKRRPSLRAAELMRRPAQRVGDFLAGRPSTALGEVVPSYRPGVTPTDLSTCLPDYAIAAIREALPAFGRQIKGFDMDDAVLTGVETRTSSPVRVPRGADFQSINTQGPLSRRRRRGLCRRHSFGGVDGIKVAEAVATAIVAKR